jgi:hypothetical protein
MGARQDQPAGLAAGQGQEEDREAGQEEEREAGPAADPESGHQGRLGEEPACSAGTAGGAASCPEGHYRPGSRCQLGH